MAKILEQVRKISSDKIAEKQKASENNYPKLIERIKAQAAFGKTSCEFEEYAIDEYSKRLLQQDGFTVYATAKKVENMYSYKEHVKTVWIVSW